MAGNIDTGIKVPLEFIGGRYYISVPSNGFADGFKFQLWGAGGGGGGSDSHYGGDGAGGSYVEGMAYNVKPGSLIEIYVAQGGGHGLSGTNVSGGSNGRSLTNFSGGYGGHSGPVGSSGSGGGGGGATVLRLNNTNIAVAGGGGGGGGGGNQSNGVNAGQLFNHDKDFSKFGPSITSGIAGGNHGIDGGGGGGGGAGSSGGAGGDPSESDVGGQPGSSGTNATLASQPIKTGEYCIGRVPGGRNVVEYPGGGVGVGGVGAAGLSYYPTGGTNGAWSSMLNTYSVWQGNGNYTYRLYFPATQSYQFDLAVDNYGTLYVDDVQMVYAPSYNSVWSATHTITAGWHTVRINGINTGGPGAIGAQILRNGSQIWNTRSAINPSEGSESLDGGNGYAVLTFYRTSNIFVKKDGVFSRVWPRTKVKNNFSKRTNTWVKIDGTWKSVNNDVSIDVHSDGYKWGDDGLPATYIYVAPPPAPAPASDGGGYDCCGGFDGGGGGGCFLPGTMITLADGTEKAIEQIQIGDYVLEALTGDPAKVIGVKTRAHDIDKYVFSLNKKTKPYITEEHPFYNDDNELCAISELATTLAPWLGPIKIVDVPNKKKITEAVTVYNLMLETGESHYANGVRVNNIVKTGGAWALVYKGLMDKDTYESWVYNPRNQQMPAHVQKMFFNGLYSITQYVLTNDTVMSRTVGKAVAWGIKTQGTIERPLVWWLNTRFRNYIVNKLFKK